MERDGWCTYMGLLQDLTYENFCECYRTACNKCPQRMLCSRVRYIEKEPLYKSIVV